MVWMAREQTKSGDPEYGVFTEVVKWNNTMECIPSWAEFLECEYIRERGEINMITESVQRYAYDRGLYNVVIWFQRCKDARISPWTLYDAALNLYEKKYGPRAMWITDEISDEFELIELELKEQQVRRQLDDVQARRAAASAKSRR